MSSRIIILFLRERLKKKKNKLKYFYEKRLYLLKLSTIIRGMMRKKKETVEEREIKDTGMVDVDFLSLFKEIVVS